MTAYTPDAPPRGVESDDDWYEIIDGVPKEWPPMSNDSSVLVFEFAHLLAVFVNANNLGRVLSEVRIRLPYPGTNDRRPDIIFLPRNISVSRRPVPRGRAWAVVPALCAEVVSPTDQAEEVREKVEEYLTAGVRQVWIIYPRAEIVDVFEASGTRTYRRGDTLPGGEIIPGFAIPLAELFPKDEVEETS